MDIKTAFLHAPLDDDVDGIIAGRPPAALVRLGIIQENSYWKLKKVLYGLRSGPKKWSECTDRNLASAQVDGPNGTANFQKCEVCKNIWKLWMTRIKFMH